MAKSVETLQAESEIRDVQRRYCRGVDRMDFAMVRDCFHPDAALDYGDSDLSVDEFVGWAEPGLRTYSMTTHFIGNQLVEVSGETAWAEHYVVAYHRCPAAGGVPEHDFICNFRYADAMERRDGQWRIARRVLLVDSWRRVPLDDLGPGPTMKPGRRDAGDLSNAMR
ncbi:MAG: nuclear transport factor 2 family protein [Novosphingobium sp.]|nr:nuclear transport factor 2 family protein [Novosphingobium sp.]MCP5404318.1 nuclear transport factor 2 family protein [Novosphingobium sp.]